MLRSPLPLTLLMLAVVGMAGGAVRAADDTIPRPQQIFTEKPRIEDYSDYNAFLVDIMEFRRQKQEREEAARAQQAAREATSAAGAAATSVDQSLYRIEGPETLDSALERARQLPHPVYEEQERYGRTTAQSFPIPTLDSPDLSEADVPGMLHDLEAEAEGLAYEDDTAGDTAEAASKDETDPYAVALRKLRGKDPNALSPEYDAENGLLIGTDGSATVIRLGSDRAVREFRVYVH